MEVAGILEWSKYASEFRVISSNILAGGFRITTEAQIVVSVNVCG
jgi:hypothetical protein